MLDKVNVKKLLAYLISKSAKVESVSALICTFSIGKIHFECGRRNLTASGSTVSDASTHVNFSKTYAYAPVVIAMPETSSTVAVVRASAVNISTTGFDLHLQRTNDTVTAVSYVAIGILP